MSRYPENESSRTSSKEKSLPLVCPICGKSKPIATAKTDQNGKPFHEECYAAQSHLQPANPDGQGQEGHSVRPWKVIAEEASHERDSKKMSALIEELNQALDTQKLDGTPKAPLESNAKSHGTS